MMEFLKRVTSGQWWANARHYITFGAGILCTLGVVTATQQTDALHNLDEIASGVTKIAAALTALAAVVAPVVNGLISGRNASPQSQVREVAAMAGGVPGGPASTPLTLDAKEALMTATAALPEVEQVKLDAASPLTATLEARTPPNVTT